MAINKKLIHFRTKAAFTTELNAGNIPDTSIVFIKDTKEIWTHGQLYSCSSYNLPDAADGVTGGIQIGYAASGRNYALKLLNKKAYVNVPWTDRNVYQTLSTPDTTYSILGSAEKLTAENAGKVAPSVYLQGLTFTPNGNVLSVGRGKVEADTFTGNLNGNATSATKATQDGSGNNIVDTYQTKTGFNSFKDQFKDLTNAEIDRLWATAPDELS